MALIVVTFAIAAVGIDAFLIEPRWLEVNTYNVYSEKVDQPFSIAVVADIQTDRVGKYEHEMLRRLKDLDVDMILMPGDYVHEPNAANRKRVISELRACFIRYDLSAHLGVFATRGNIDGLNWGRSFDGLPVTTFPKTKSLDLGRLRITGLQLHDSFNPRLQLPGTDRFHIVLGHAPDFALGDTGGDLLVAGHTHGGQVRLPLFGPLFTFSHIPRDWAAGMRRIPQGGMLMVSRGIGMERGLAPRLRFNCRPEIVVIHIKPQG